MRQTALFAAAFATLAVQPALAGKQVFVSSAEYDITVQLNYTRQVSPEGEQGGFSGFTSTGEFRNVRFGPSPAEGFEAWFELRPPVPAGAPARPTAAMPARQIAGEGTIGPFAVAPAWEDPKEPIQPKITSGPRPFAPHLEVLTFEMAHVEEEDSIPVVPLVPVVWLRYSESYSVAEPELQWEYPDFATGAIESDAVVFSAPIASLAQGEDFEVKVPYANGAAKGEWKILFWAKDGQEEE